MSTRGLREPPLRGYVRNFQQRRMTLDLDLNALPREYHDQEGPSANASSQDVQVGQLGVSVPPTPINVDTYDDDVIISSRRAFEEARNNSRRNRGRTVVVDVDSGRTFGPSPNNRNNRRRLSSNPMIIDCDLYIDLEGSSDSMKDNVQSVASTPPPPPPPPPKEPTFNCPVCIGPLVEEMSTKCGHIFCKACIKAAIAAQRKCPTCRRKLTKKDTIRVYLPAAS